MQRKAWKEGLLDAIARRVTADPVPLDTAARRWTRRRGSRILARHAPAAVTATTRSAALRARAREGRASTSSRRSKPRQAAISSSIAASFPMRLKDPPPARRGPAARRGRGHRPPAPPGRAGLVHARQRARPQPVVLARPGRHGRLCARRDAAPDRAVLPGRAGPATIGRPGRARGPAPASRAWTCPTATSNMPSRGTASLAL